MDRSRRARGRLHPRSALFIAFGLGLLGGFGACRSSSAPTSAAGLLSQGTTRMSELVAETVTDPARAERASAVLVAYLESEAIYFADLEQHRRTLLALNLNPNATRQEFDVLNARMNLARRSFQVSTTDMLAELKQELQAEEWGSIFTGMQSMDAQWQELGQ